MSLTRAQQILLKRAQAEAGILDYDYRGSIATVSGMEDCTSSKDPRLTDRHCDQLLAFFEAIHWQAVDAGHLQPSCKPDAVFRQRGYWADKNPRGNTSRDRYADGDLTAEIAETEAALAALGCGHRYVMAIQNNLRRNGGFSPAAYLGAIKRSLTYKQRKSDSDQSPF